MPLPRLPDAAAAAAAVAEGVSSWEASEEGWAWPGGCVTVVRVVEGVCVVMVVEGGVCSVRVVEGV